MSAPTNKSHLTESPINPIGYPENQIAMCLQQIFVYFNAGLLSKVMMYWSIIGHMHLDLRRKKKMGPNRPLFKSVVVS